jgi:hypothetical protein
MIKWQNNFKAKKGQIMAPKNQGRAGDLTLKFFRLIILPENYSAINCFVF